MTSSQSNPPPTSCQISLIFGFSLAFILIKAPARGSCYRLFWKLSKKWNVLSNYMGREKFGISLKSLSEICKSLGKFWKIFRKIPKIYQKFGVSVMTSSLAKPPLPLVINRHHLETPSPPKVMTSYVNDPLFSFIKSYLLFEMLCYYSHLLALS